MTEDEPQFKPKTWDDIKTFDDLVLEEERNIILELEQKHKDAKIEQCPYLKKTGQFWYYCSFGMKKGEAENKSRERPSPSNSLYCRHTDLIEMQLHCLDNYSNCCIYQKSDVDKSNVGDISNNAINDNKNNENESKKRARKIRNILLEDECIFHLMILKQGDALKNEEFYKKCYACFGTNKKCKDYEPCFPKK